jgi:Flp pilus assembly pilin Flp
MTGQKKTFAVFFQDEGGTTAIEYGLILGLMVIAIVAALRSTGDATGTAFNNAAEGFGI